LGHFAAGRVDPARFATLFPAVPPVSPDAMAALSRAMATLRAIADRGDDAFLVDLPKGGRLGAKVGDALVSGYTTLTFDLGPYFAPINQWLTSYLAPDISLLQNLQNILLPFASGAAVGGGSVVYANTQYRASPEFFANPQWAGINDGSAALAPHYDTAEKMLGVQTVPHGSDGQDLLREVGKHFGVEDTFRRTPVGVFFGKPGATVPDPYFGGEGPERTGCTRCGACMVGCREGAKNTLVKNYLWFAEKRGVEILPDREVIDDLFLITIICKINNQAPSKSFLVKEEGESILTYLEIRSLVVEVWCL
jgi:ferredoxin